jgi:signal transduction histidine kinase
MAHLPEHDDVAAEPCVACEREFLRSPGTTATQVRSSERLLSAVVAATQCLVAEADLQVAVAAALEALRLHTGLDRVYVFRDQPDHASVVLHTEALGSGIPSVRQVFGDRVFHDHEFPTVIPPLRAGEIYQSIQPQRTGENETFNAAMETRSDLMVPIAVGGEFWGIVGFDDCQTEHTWSAVEIDVLRGLASGIAAAVLRESALRERANNDIALATRDHLLAAVALSMRQLLGNEEGTFEAAVNATLCALGQASRIHRVKVFVQRPDSQTGELFHFLDYEWWAPGLASQSSIGLTQFPNSLMTVWTERLQAGHGIWYLIDEVPIEVREAFFRVGVRSTGAVPIFGGARYIGCVAFDDCVHERIWSPAEIDALSTAARIIGSAIHRHALQREMLVERDLRIDAERIRADEANAHAVRIERHSALLSAVAASAEELLAARDLGLSVDAVLARIGGATRADRACLARFDWTPEDRERHGWQEIAHEWARPGVARQMDGELRRFAMLRSDATWDTALRQFSEENRILAQVAEMHEPFRSEQLTLGIAWSLCYPILFEGQVWGLLGFDYATAFEDYDEADLAALQTVASTIADALTRQELERRSLAAERARVDELAQANAALQRSADRLVSEEGLDAFLCALLLEATAISGARSGAVFTFDAATECLRMRVRVFEGREIDLAGDPAMTLWREPVPLAISRPWVESLRSSPEPLWFDNHMPPEHLRWPAAEAWHVAMGHRVTVELPLFARTELIGFFGQSFDTVEWRSQFNLEQARAMAQHAALALQLDRTARRLRESELVAALVSERGRIAHELHDTLAQTFTGIFTQLQAARAYLADAPEVSIECIARSEAGARQGLRDARRAVQALQQNAAEFSDLRQGLESVVRHCSAEGSLTLVLDVHGESHPVDAELGLNLLRIAQESIANALRHAQASKVTVTLVFGAGGVTLTVCDDGCGFDARLQRDGTGFGLQSMQARAVRIGADLVFDTGPAQGTRVVVRAPFHGWRGDLPEGGEGQDE